jgi:hypothetical protein
MEKRFLLRKEPSGEEIRIIGTAWVPHEVAWKTLEEVQSKEAAVDQGGEGDLRVWVDIDMLYALFCPVMEKLLNHTGLEVSGRGK